MTARVNYVLTDPYGNEFDLWGEQGIPDGPYDLRYNNAKRPAKPLGPNYDGTWSSVQAALLYNPVRRPAMWQVFRHLYYAGARVSGRILIDAYGTEALRRQRDLRDKLGWPIMREAPHGANGMPTRGVWEYWLELPSSFSRPRRKRLIWVS
jgi:hypothetical protein